MNLQQLQIEKKHRRSDVFLADLSDFSYREAGVISSDELLANPNISLYCFDDHHRNAIFVELDAQIDLPTASFVFRTQYEHAKRLIVVPYELFVELANNLPKVQRPIFIYMTARCGSTLLSHAFTSSRSVVSLAEPDAITQFVHLRQGTGGARDAELKRLAQSTLRFYFRHHHGEQIHSHALKLRVEGLRVMDLFHTEFPNAKHLFLYRDALGVVTSFYRVFRYKLGRPESDPINEWQAKYEAAFHQDLSSLINFLPKGATRISLPEQLTLRWLISIEPYLAQVSNKLPVVAVRHNDLIHSREQTLREIFCYCGLPESGIIQALQAFEHDSQAGTTFARENPDESNSRTLDDSQTRSVLSILKRHPTVKTSDHEVPGTLKIKVENDQCKSVNK